MEKRELIKWARHCASDAKCEGCPYDGGNGCRDSMLLSLVTELEESIPKADFDVALNGFQKNDAGTLTYEQYIVYEAVFDANEKRINRDQMLNEHKEYYMMYNGNLLSAKELIKAYENDTGRTAMCFANVKAYYHEEILVEIPKADMTYAMLIKHNKRVDAICLYRENENCPLYKANEAIKHIEATI